MFEAAELGRKVRKPDYREQEPKLRMDLLQAQFALRDDGDFPVIVVVAGDDGTGCNEVMNLLHEWMDPRYLRGNAFSVPTDEERERPLFWRYWRVLPPKREIGIFFRAWTTDAIMARLREGNDDGELARMIGHITKFEKALVDDGALIVKFWLHLPKAEFKKRFKAAQKDPIKNWQGPETDRHVYGNYNEARRIAEEVLRRTSTGDAPWHIVESTDNRYRNLAVVRTLFEAMARRIETSRKDEVRRGPSRPDASVADPITILDTVDLSASLEKEEYEKKLRRGQAKLNRLSRQAQEAGIATVLVFEGWDAAGKGGIIRRLVAGLDAANYRLIPIAAPTDEEASHHYLWRFWRHLPRAGHFTAFDRSWYGRVLVERVEGFATEAEWRRAYTEINDFEEQLTERGIVLLKFWLHIDKDEQLRRFKLREETPFKRHKITDDDWRNREKWNDYDQAANEMIERTSTPNARWHLIAGNDKRHARVDVIETVCAALAKAL